MLESTPSLPEAAAAPRRHDVARLLILIAKCLLAVLLVGWLIRSGRFDVKQLKTVRPGLPLLGVFFCQAMMIVCQALRWYLLCRTQKLNLSLSQVLHISLIGQFAGVFTPSSLGLDGARLLYAGAFNRTRRAPLLSTVLMDRVLGLCALLLLGVVATGALAATDPNVVLRRAQAAFCALAVGAVLSLWLLARASRGAADRWERFPGVANLARALGSYRGRDRTMMRALGWSLLTHLFNALGLYCGFCMLHAPPPLGLVLGVAPLVILSSLIPLTPLGLGVTDAVSVTFFDIVGVGGGAAVTMLLRTTWVVLSLCCAVAYLWPMQALPDRSLALE